jgi:hypothetical protein
MWQHESQVTNAALDERIPGVFTATGWLELRRSI